MCNVIIVEDIVSVTDGRETVTISFYYLHLFRLCLILRNYTVVPYTPDITSGVQKKIFAGIHFDGLLQTETDHSSLQFNLWKKYKVFHGDALQISFVKESLNILFNQ